MSAEPDHLPERLWWVLARLSLAWGFNWTAMNVALAEVPPWTFRSLCLGLGSAVLFGATPDPARVVRDGTVCTGGGVTAGIDFALTVVAEIAGDETAQAIQLAVEYAPSPPFDAGRPETAPPAVLERIHAV